METSRVALSVLSVYALSASSKSATGPGFVATHYLSLSSFVGTFPLCVALNAPNFMFLEVISKLMACNLP